MKVIYSLFTIFLLTCTGCDSDSEPTEDGRSVGITAEDVAWATGWTIYKWRLGALTSERVRSIQIVAIGPSGDSVYEGGSVGLNEPLDPDKQVSIALKKDGSNVAVRLRYGGASLNSKVEGVFDETNWGSSDGLGVAGDLLLVATDGGEMPVTAEDLLKMSCNKLCLRLIAVETHEAEHLLSPD